MTYNRLIVISYLIYTILWESLVWIGGIYVIVTFDWPKMNVIVLFLMSGIQIQPARWRELIGETVG